VAGDDCIGCLERPLRKDLEKPARTPCELHGAQELRTTSAAADDGAIAPHEVPGREPLLFDETLEERGSCFVAHRQEPELLSAVEVDDDPRRPATESSTRVVDEHWAAKHCSPS
jgi:hypothetical protein